MNCKEFLDRLDAYLDGEMAQPERQAFLAHAQGCSTCREELRCAEAIREALLQMNEGLSVPLAAQAGWRNAVKQESRRRKRRGFYRAISAAAAAFVLLAGTTAVFRATGVLDFDAELSASGVHIAPSAPRAEYYDVAQSYSAAEEPALARYAQIESDGAMVAGDAEDAMAPEASDIAPASLSAAEEAGSEGESGVQAQDKQFFVRSATREMYSESFDTAHQSIQGLVEEYNGHIVSDAISGQNGARSATIAADVPTAELDAFLQALDFVSEVTYRSVNSEDISTNYYDAQGRLETLRLEKDRLNELIATAADSEELQALDAQLQEVYAQIDTLESKLRNFDSQLEYARVDIVLHEGAQLKATAITGGTTTGGSASQGLRRSLESLGAFFHDMGVSLAVIAPYAGIAVAVALVVGLIWLGISRLNRRRRHD